MPPLTPANQLIRAQIVTASEVGALLGEHPYQSPGTIFDRLTGASIEREPTLAMRFGSEAEPILKGFARDRLGVNIRMNSRTYVHPRVRLCATPDGTIVDDGGAVVMVNGWQNALIEFKLSFGAHRFAGKALPPDIEWQVRAQMACTHRNRVVVYVFANGQEKVYVVERERNREGRLTRAVDAFWRDHMEPRIRPAEPVETLSL